MTNTTDTDLFFWQAFDLVLRHEGGYINDPRDPGGETKFGISDRRDGVVDGLADLDGDGKGDKPIKEITEAEAGLIYKAEYWQPCGCSHMPPEIAIAVFDTAVNCGNSIAIRMIQRVLGVMDDGICGPVTTLHIKNAQPRYLIAAYMAERMAHYAALKTWNIYGRGWSRRTIDTAHFCLSLA